jgi:hypothetical protein
MDLHARGFEPPLAVLLPGRLTAADGVEPLLDSATTIIKDPLARQLANALEIHSTPFAMAVAEGRVVGKSYIEHLEELVRLSDHVERANDALPSRELQTAQA